MAYLVTGQWLPSNGGGRGNPMAGTTFTSGNHVSNRRRINYNNI